MALDNVGGNRCSFDMEEWMTGRMGWSAAYMGNRHGNVCSKINSKVMALDKAFTLRIWLLIRVLDFLQLHD
jgi:hypothetical protein